MGLCRADSGSVALPQPLLYGVSRAMRPQLSLVVVGLDLGRGKDAGVRLSEDCPRAYVKCVSDSEECSADRPAEISRHASGGG